MLIIFEAEGIKQKGSHSKITSLFVLQKSNLLLIQQ